MSVGRPENSWLNTAGPNATRATSAAGIPYVKKWREARKNTPRPMIQDKIPLLKPLFKMTLLIPGGLPGVMIQDEILLERIDRTTFIATGPGG